MDERCLLVQISPNAEMCLSKRLLLPQCFVSSLFTKHVCELLKKKRERGTENHFKQAGGMDSPHSVRCVGTRR